MSGTKLKTEVDKVTGFSISFPADWLRDEQPGANMKIVQWTPPGMIPSYDSPPCMLLLQIHQTDMDEEKYYQASLDQLRRMDPRIEPTTEALSIGSTAKGRRLRWNNDVVYSEQISVSRGGFIFVFGFTAGHADFKKYQSFISVCMKSAKFESVSDNDFDPICWKIHRSGEYNYELRAPTFMRESLETKVDALFPPTRHLLELHHEWFFGAMDDVAHLRLILAVENVEGLDLEKYNQLYEAQLDKESIEMKKSESDHVDIPIIKSGKKIGETKAIKISYRNVKSLEKTIALFTVIKNNAYILSLTSTAPPAEKREIMLFDLILQSFSILDSSELMAEPQEFFLYENKKENVFMRVSDWLKPSCSFEEGTDFFRYVLEGMSEMEYTPCVNLAIKENVENKTIEQITEEMISAMEGAKIVSRKSVDSFLGAPGLEISFIGDIPSPAPGYPSINLQFKQRYSLKDGKLYCLMFTARRDSFKTDYEKMAATSFDSIRLLSQSSVSKL